MLRLNDYCLSNIFDKLKIRDQLRLTAVCERFCDIIVSVQWRSRFRRFETSGNGEIDKLSHYEYMSLFKLIGHSIEHLIIAQKTDRRVYTWRPEATFYLRFEFPVLRVLEWNIHRDEFEMQLVAAHCPRIEELYLTSKTYLTFEEIVDMRHLRILHGPKNFIYNAYQLQQILTLPLTELCFKLMFLVADIHPSAVAVIGASHLRVMRICYYSNTPAFMACMMALASTSERRYPLTIHIKRECRINGFNWDRCLFSFRKYKRSLQPLIDNQLPGQPRVFVTWETIEFRFFLPIK